MSIVTIVDYGIGNIKSVQRGVERVGATAILSSDPDEVVNADRVILPGVGAFEDGMNGLKKSGMVDAIYQFCNKGNQNSFGWTMERRNGSTYIIS